MKHYVLQARNPESDQKNKWYEWPKKYTTLKEADMDFRATLVDPLAMVGRVRNFFKAWDLNKIEVRYVSKVKEGTVMEVHDYKVISLRD